jgi:hypothetical protein
MNPEHWEMEFYEDEHGNEPCKDFIEGLPTAKKLASRSALVNILARQGPDVCESEFGKNLGEGLYEFRLRHHEAEILMRSAGLPRSARLHRAWRPSTVSSPTGRRSGRAYGEDSFLTSYVLGHIVCR